MQLWQTSKSFLTHMGMAMLHPSGYGQHGAVSSSVVWGWHPAACVCVGSVTAKCSAENKQQHEMMYSCLDS